MGHVEDSVNIPVFFFSDAGMTPNTKFVEQLRAAVPDKTTKLIMVRYPLRLLQTLYPSAHAYRHCAPPAGMQDRPEEHDGGAARPKRPVRRGPQHDGGNDPVGGIRPSHPAVTQHDEGIRGQR